MTIVTVPPFRTLYLDGKRRTQTFADIKRMLPDKQADVIGDLTTKGVVIRSPNTFQVKVDRVFVCRNIFQRSVCGLVRIPYALLIGMFAGITTSFPYLGPYIRTGTFDLYHFSICLRFYLGSRYMR